MKTAFLVAFLALAWSVQPTQAQEPTRFKNKTFDLPTPSGFCVPDPGDEFAQKITAGVKNTGGTLVKLAADCRQLAAGGFIYDYLAYSYVTKTEAEILVGDVAAQRKALCDRAVRPRTPGADVDIHAAIEKAGRELEKKTPGFQYIGLLSEDAHGCIGGLLLSASSQSQTYVINVDLLVTVIHGRSLSFSLYSKYESSARSDEALARAKAIAAELDARNPD